MADEAQLEEIKRLISDRVNDDRVREKAFDQLYEEGAENGKVMCIPLHPFLIGQPHRIGPFAEALEYITGHDEVWVTTGREIAEWYYEHCYDEAVAAAATRGEG